MRSAPVPLQGSADWKPPIVTSRELVCCVHLQLLLYFSVWYDLLLILIHTIVGWYKWRFIKGPIVVAIFGINLLLVLVVEPCRIWLGYTGNLNESVAEMLLFIFFCIGPCFGVLAASLVLTSLQLTPEQCSDTYRQWWLRGFCGLQPAQCSLLPSKPCVLAIEKACWVVHILLILWQFVLGMRALKRLVREQSARFFRSLEADGGTSLAQSFRSGLGHDGEDNDDGEDASGAHEAMPLVGSDDSGVSARIYGRSSGSPSRNSPTRGPPSRNSPQRPTAGITTPTRRRLQLHED